MLNLNHSYHIYVVRLGGRPEGLQPLPRGKSVL